MSIPKLTAVVDLRVVKLSKNSPHCTSPKDIQICPWGPYPEGSNLNLARLHGQDVFARRGSRDQKD